jgi:hypothetical protein
MVDGPNVYAYVVNNPVNYVDPLGLDLIDWLVTGTWDPDDEVAQAAYAALWGGIVDPRGCDTYIECLTKCISITAIPGISPDWEEVLVKYTVWGAITAGSARATPGYIWRCYSNPFGNVTSCYSGCNYTGSVGCNIHRALVTSGGCWVRWKRRNWDRGGSANV